MKPIEPQIFYDTAGKQVRVILKPKDFQKLIEQLEDYEDYETLTELLPKIKKTYRAEEVFLE